jgi:hypothetical protein
MKCKVKVPKMCRMKTNATIVQRFPKGGLEEEDRDGCSLNPAVMRLMKRRERRITRLIQEVTTDVDNVTITAALVSPKASPLVPFSLKAATVPPSREWLHIQAIRSEMIPVMKR